MSSEPKAAIPSLEELIDLGGRTAVVTGGAMGIGLGIAHRLHQAGASVVIADLDLDAAEQAAEELRARRAGSAVSVRVDVSDPDDVERMVDAAVEAFGGIDILVNNAGIFPMVPLGDLDLDTFQRVVGVNLTGLYLCTKAASAQMVAQGRGGRIVNITSIDALHPSMVGLSHYDASKHGVWGFTKNLALELAPHGIWVNAIAPGAIATPGVERLQASEGSSDVDSTPLVSAGTIYAASYSGGVYGLEAKDGAVRWRFACKPRTARL